jgi:hypothetical protein
MFQPFTFSIYPELLAFSWYSVAVLRIFIGFYWLRLIKNHSNLLNLALILVSILLIVGLLTQMASLILSIYGLWRWHGANNQTRSDLWFLLSIVTLSLLFLGPGPFAFDHPF